MELHGRRLAIRRDPLIVPHDKHVLHLLPWVDWLGWGTNTTMRCFLGGRSDGGMSGRGGYALLARLSCASSTWSSHGEAWLDASGSQTCTWERCGGIGLRCGDLVWRKRNEELRQLIDGACTTGSYSQELGIPELALSVLGIALRARDPGGGENEVGCQSARDQRSKDNRAPSFRSNQEILDQKSLSQPLAMSPSTHAIEIGLGIG